MSWKWPLSQNNLFLLLSHSSKLWKLINLPLKCGLLHQVEWRNGYLCPGKDLPNASWPVYISICRFRWNFVFITAPWEKFFLTSGSPVSYLLCCVLCDTCTLFCKVWVLIATYGWWQHPKASISTTILGYVGWLFLHVTEIFRSFLFACKLTIFRYICICQSQVLSDACIL